MQGWFNYDTIDDQDDIRRALKREQAMSVRHMMLRILSHRTTERVGEEDRM